MSGKGEEDPDKWFSYLLEPAKLNQDIEDKKPFSELKPLLHDFLSNLLNNQTAGFFADNPQELWFAKSEERKCTVLRTLCLRLASYSGWCLTDLEQYLPSPLLLFLLTSLVQVQPGQDTEETSLANTVKHTELNISSLANPGPSLHSLTLLHRWIVRTSITIRTPVKMDRTSNMMVPGVKRDPSLIYRDQTNTLVSAVVPTSIKWLQAVLDSEVSPEKMPSHRSFSLKNNTDWDTDTLQHCDRNLFLALIAYDLGRCYLFCEDYFKSKECFTKYFGYTQAGLTPESQQLLNMEIDKDMLAGYLLCLGIDHQEFKPKAPTFLAGKIADSSVKNYDDIEDVLESDISSKNVGMAAREALEDDLMEDCDARHKKVLPAVQINNIIKRTLMGLPLSLKYRNILSSLDKSLLEKKLMAVYGSLSSSTDKASLKSFAIELIMSGILTDNSDLAKTMEIQGLDRSLMITPVNKERRTKPTLTFSVETFGNDKIVRLNNCLQLMYTFSGDQIPGMIASLGGKNVRKVSHRWIVESDQLYKQKNVSDAHWIMLAKVNQLKRMKRFGEAKEMLDKIQGNVEAEQLCLGLEAAEDDQQQLTASLSAVREGDKLSKLGHSSLTIRTMTSLLNIGDWDGVLRLNNSLQTSNNAQTTAILSLARSVALLMINIHANNPPLVKKSGRDVWEQIASIAQSGPAPGSKRQSKESSIDNSLTRAVMVSWMKTVTHEHVARVLCSLLASLFNVVRDDPNTDILSPDGALWPNTLTTPLQERTVEDMLTQVLTSVLATHPHDSSLLRMMADLQYANSHHAAALALYVESAAVMTDFYHQDLGPLVIDDCQVSRMVTCTRELGHLTQAVILSQFTQEPNYAQAFKFLEDRTSDGSDSLYGCIWDMAILEFAMSLHTKRGEADKRKEALQCIWQLELNTNNDEEILKEAANVRKSMFFRSLALQLF